MTQTLCFHSLPWQHLDESIHVNKPGLEPTTATWALLLYGTNPTEWVEFYSRHISADQYIETLPNLKWDYSWLNNNNSK